MSSGKKEKRDELQRPIAIYYEHPDWFRPLFERLDESGVPWKKIDAGNHQYDATDVNPFGGRLESSARSYRCPT